jgi:hypothetical protein
MRGQLMGLGICGLFQGERLENQQSLVEEERMACLVQQFA